MTNLNTDANPSTVADAYLAAWNADDGARRRALMTRAWREDARYVDPLMHADGRDNIASMIETARAQFPGLAFLLSGRPDGHGDYVRFSWSLGPAGGEAIAGGADMIRLDREGRIQGKALTRHGPSGCPTTTFDDVGVLAIARL